MGVPAIIAAFGIAGSIGYFLFDRGKISTPPHPGPTKQVNLADVVYQTGTAKPQALALYNALKTQGYPKTPEFAGLVTAFQKAHNNDPNAFRVYGPLPTNGVYDTRTSAGLTLYTHDPIPADPSSPLPPIADPSNAQDKASWGVKSGNWAQSIYNVAAYIYKYGQDGSMTLQQFIQQYQYDFNNDTKSPGPKGAYYTPPVKITTPLVQNGLLDEPTKQSMLRGIGPGINPDTLKYPPTSAVKWTQGSADLNIKPGGIVEAP